MDFLLDAWSMVGWATDVVPGTLLPRTVMGRPLVLYRRADGEVVALDDRCPHRSAPLSRGRLEGDRIACGYHGLEFDDTGRCVRNPHGRGIVPAAAVVARYPVLERHSALWVWLGAGTADPDLVPDYGTLEGTAAHTTRRDHFVMDLPYELIVDNLLDCSHVSFLHQGVLGNLEMLGVDTQVRQDGDTVTTTRYSRDVPPPGMFDMLYEGDGSPVDTWTEIRWQAPANMLLDTGVTEPGRPRREGTGYYGVHVLTPETAGTTHYFTAASRWNVRPGTETPEMQAKISDLRRFAFEEQDEPMIRAQHRNLQLFGPLTDPGELEPVLLETDAGVVRWRRVMARRLAEQRAGSVPRRSAPTTVPATVLVRVADIADDGIGVRRLRLEPVGGAVLPPATAGAHVDVHLPTGQVRQYSLCEVPTAGRGYTIAVKLEQPSRGGSAAVHALAEGDRLELGPVRNAFPLADGAAEHLLLAGGIGVTPLLAMARHLLDSGGSFALHHFVRSDGHGPFADALSAAPLSRAAVRHVGLDGQQTAAALGRLLAGRSPDAHLYACGPAPFLAAVSATAGQLGWPPDAVHEERFGPGAAAGGGSFTVELARSGRVVAVGAGESVLAALRREGVPAASSCEAGVCGTCVTPVLAGRPDHRDSYLTPDERAAGDRMCLCVSRALTGTLTLDL